MALTVLIVEDEAGLRTIYDRILSSSGCETLLARNGEEAIQILSEYVPDLIFLDMLMPIISGMDVLQYISNEQPRMANTHVVVVSSAKEYARYLDIVPSAEFMLKPILPAQIRNVAKRLMGVLS
ncbi:MAG: response regulator [Aggregatilineales bacterium]